MDNVMIPFDSTPHVSYGPLHAIILDPPGMLDWVDPGTKITVEIAHDLTVNVDRVMRERWPDAKKFLYVHDFSRAVDYQQESLEMLIDWGKRSIREVAGIWVVIGPLTRTVDKAAVHFGARALNLFGVPMGVSNHVAELLREHGLRPAEMGIAR